ncbi:hypothetical protein EXS66_01495 [Candidatus Saccharibacteria bacterium]|nr:hypothetical protein [Candidatus Saccharibacteria bacterium]
MESEKFDISKIYPVLYKASKDKPTIINVPVLRILAINGEGDQKGPRFKDSIDALYAVAYAIRSLPRKNIILDGFVDFNTTPLEAMWSMKNGSIFDASQKNNLLWEVFIVVPGFVTQKVVNMAITQTSLLQPNERYHDLHISSLQEKTSIQILHTGSLKGLRKATTLLGTHLLKKGYKPALRHHEIYFSDPTRIKTGRLRVIVRQPVTKV